MQLALMFMAKVNGKKKNMIRMASVEPGELTEKHVEESLRFLVMALTARECVMLLLRLR